MPLHNFTSKNTTGKGNSTLPKDIPKQMDGQLDMSNDDVAQQL